jgi:hypothetical protein
MTERGLSKKKSDGVIVYLGIGLRSDLPPAGAS